MTCAEFKEQAGALALGVLDGNERAACHRHLADSAHHEGCEAALRQAHDTAALLALALPPLAPSATVWAAIERGTRALPSLAARRRRWLPATMGVLAAAAIVALLWSWRDRASLERQLATATARAHDESRARAQCVAELEAAHKDAALRREALALLERPGTRLVGLAAQGAAAASANVILGSARAFVVGRGLMAPAGKDYELWMIRGDRKIPAGLLRGGADGALVSVIDPELLAGGAPDAIAVTLEAAGGKPQPEGPIVLVGKI
jgi:hypothetical protein